MEVFKYEVLYVPGPDNHVSTTVTAYSTGLEKEDLLCGGWNSMWLAQHAVHSAINRHRAKLKKEKEQEKDGL